jgi:arylsulfatase A-like enzyme
MKVKLILLFILFTGFVYGQKHQKPNIVFCLADDWGWPHAGAYGDEGVNTPHFDRVADEGILFNHAYVSSPSCTPSRNSFITGKHHWELGPGANLWSKLPVKHQSFIHLLADNGYVTGRTTAKTWGPGDLTNWIAHHSSHPGNTAYDTFNEFLDNTNAKNEPFFFWLGTSDPHRDYEKDSGKKSGIDISKVHLFKHYPDAEEVRSDISDYYYEVQRWDALVGSVIAQLEQHNLLENTIIVITGDHGMPFPRCKGNLYDSGVRVPFAVRWGNAIKAGIKADDFISFADIAPTLLEAAGVSVPKDITGKSFLNILQSKRSGMIDPENRSDIVFGRERHTPAQEKPNEGGYPSRGYRNNDYLYIRNYEPDLWPAGTGDQTRTNLPYQWYADCDAGPAKDYIIENKDRDKDCYKSYQLCFAKRPAKELYDLKADPDQLHNVAANPNYSDIMESMRLKLQEKLEKLNDPRAKDPNYDQFYNEPYLGMGGAKKYPSKKDD